jgi:hypothetical protein
LRIDAAEIVCRLNRGFVREPASQGRRTDLLFVAMRIEMDDIRRQCGDASVVYAGPHRWIMSEGMWAERESIAYYPMSAYRRLIREVGAPPSTGLIAIDCLITQLAAVDVQLFGFDWKQTRTFYEPARRHNVHDWEAERRMVERWAGQGRVVLPPGSERRKDSLAAARGARSVRVAAAGPFARAGGAR